MAVLSTGVSVDGPIWVTMPRSAVNSANSTGTGNLRLTAFTARRNGTSTGVRTLTGSTAAGATPTLARIGLYLINAAGDGTLIASTANDTALFSVANAQYQKNWSTPVDLIAGERYAVGILLVTGAAAPTLVGASQVSTAAGIANLDLPWWAGFAGSQADLPASFVYGDLVNNLNSHYARLI